MNGYLMDKVMDDLRDWAREKGNHVFEDFLNFLDNVEKKKYKIKFMYHDNEYDNQEEGTIDCYSFCYNRRFDDFDFEIKLSEERYGYSIDYIFMDSIEKVSETEYKITAHEGGVYTLAKIDS